MHSKTQRLAPYYTTQELEELYRKEKNVVNRARLHMIWLYSQGQSRKEVAQNTGYCLNWTHQLIHRYNTGSLSKLFDGRVDNKGKEPLLTYDEQKTLYKLLLKPHPDGGVWTGPKVAAWIADTTGKKVNRRRGWVYLKRLGFTLKHPRPAHYQADKKEQKIFKKNSNIW